MRALRTILVWCLQVPFYLISFIIALAVCAVTYIPMCIFAYFSNKKRFDERLETNFYLEHPKMKPPNRWQVLKISLMWPFGFMFNYFLTLDNVFYRWIDAKDRFVETGSWRRPLLTDEYEHNLLVIEDDAVVAYPAGSYYDE
ncbi:MAG: hypothetical protein JWN38_104 [Candidatus Saccharibacteria bacterium]|nr:hypothetical protein [Candidatus Saccharibacteria bacterium]